MTFDPNTRTIDNLADTGRKWPTTALAPNVLTDAEGVVTEKITGPAGTATVKLSKPANAIRSITSFTTATGVASTGGGKKQYLTETTDYVVNKKDPNNGNVATLKNATATDYSAETWVVEYSPDAAEGTIGGQSKVGR
jgi:hypothetical protein